MGILAKNSSLNKNTTNAIPLTTVNEMKTADFQAQLVPPPDTATKIKIVLIIEVKNPIQSMSLSFSFNEPVTGFNGTKKTTNEVLTTVIGHEIQKDHLQLAFCARSPPMSGPSPFPKAVVAATNPKYLPLSLVVKRSENVIITKQFTPPPPKPLKPANTNNMVGFWENPATKFPTNKQQRENRNTCFAPKMSENLPYKSWKFVLAIKYEVPTQAFKSDVCPKSSAIEGREVVTAVWSKNDTKSDAVKQLKVTKRSFLGRV